MIGKVLRKITIVPNILYIEEKQILPVYISNHNFSREKWIILLIIQNEEKEGWHYLAIKKKSALLHKKTLNHKGDFYCLNCLNYFRAEIKLKIFDKICKNKDFCGLKYHLKKMKY